MTDGEPTDNYKAAATKLRQLAETNKMQILNAYKQGLKRGLRQVIAWIADGTIICKDGEFKVNADLKIEIKRAKPDKTYQILRYKLTPVDLGLENRE